VLVINALFDRRTPLPSVQHRLRYQYLYAMAQITWRRMAHCLHRMCPFPEPDEDEDPIETLTQTLLWLSTSQAQLRDLCAISPVATYTRMIDTHWYNVMLEMDKYSNDTILTPPTMYRCVLTHLLPALTELQRLKGRRKVFADRAIAIAMALHKRLGAASLLSTLPKELVGELMVQQACVAASLDPIQDKLAL